MKLEARSTARGKGVYRGWNSRFKSMIYFWIMFSWKRYFITGGVLWEADTGTESGVQRITSK